MIQISIYDNDAEIIDAICEDNDMTAAEVVELLMDFVDDIKIENNLI